VPGIVGGVPLPGPEAPEPGGGAGGHAGTQPPPQDARTVSLSDGRPAPRNLDVEATPRSATDAPPAIRARTPRRRTVFAVAGVGLIAVVAAVAVLAVVNLLPTATISITPTTDPLGPLELTVAADPDAVAVDAARLVIPATRIEIPVSVSGQFEATGKELIEEKATGSVTFQNCDTGSAHSFPAGSVVSTPDGVRFVTKSTVNLDRAKINPAFACTAGTTAVTASAAGPEGNVVAGTITRLPSGYDPIVLSVVNRSATSGGSREELTRITREDVDGALASLQLQLAEAFTTESGSPDGTPPGASVIPGTAALGESTPTVDPDPLVGQELTAFELGLTATGTVLAVDDAPVTGVALTRLLAAVPTGYQLVEGSVRTVVEEPAVSGATVVYAVTVRGEVSRMVDLAGLRDQVLGLSIPAARKIIEPYGLVEVTVWPDWVTSIPSDPTRVDVVLGDGNSEAGGRSPSPGPAGSGGGTP